MQRRGTEASETMPSEHSNKCGKNPVEIEAMPATIQWERAQLEGMKPETLRARLSSLLLRPRRRRAYAAIIVCGCVA
jgi:hypothetical protein